MRPVTELGPSYRVQMHMMQQQQQQQRHRQHHHQQQQQQTTAEFDEQPVSRTYQYRKVSVRNDYNNVVLSRVSYACRRAD